MTRCECGEVPLYIYRNKCTESNVRLGCESCGISGPYKGDEVLALAAWIRLMGEDWTHAQEHTGKSRMLLITYRHKEGWCGVKIGYCLDSVWYFEAEECVEECLAFRSLPEPYAPPEGGGE